MSSGSTMVIGLTGQTGAGKSTLSQMFADRGVAVINADLVARETMEHSNACLSDLVLEFSTEVIHPDATLNREKLAEICFSDRKKLKRLNEITFPYIIDAIVRKLEQEKQKGSEMVVLDAPTLFESGLDARCDWVVAVIADAANRLARIIARDTMTTEAAQRRVNAQNSDAFYITRADDVLHNDEGLEELKADFSDLFSKLREMAEKGDWADHRKKPAAAKSKADPVDEPAQAAAPAAAEEAAPAAAEAAPAGQEDGGKDAAATPADPGDLAELEQADDAQEG